ncbi:hypothetical protein FACS1894105_14530 [Clostridia bacterium]|nr:hypothetical protein FACS1894105_14530 [Clostridia bacterium]
MKRSYYVSYRFNGELDESLISAESAAQAKYLFWIKNSDYFNLSFGELLKNIITGVRTACRKEISP